MAALASNEPIGTTARLGVARLGAARLGAVPRSSQLTTAGVYAWTRSDGSAGETNDGRHPVAVVGGWVTLRS